MASGDVFFKRMVNIVSDLTMPSGLHCCSGHTCGLGLKSLGVSSGLTNERSIVIKTRWPSWLRHRSRDMSKERGPEFDPRSCQIFI